MTERLTKCARCDEETEDWRILWMACGYEMNELGCPFDQDKYPNCPEKFYKLTVCKNCRSDWMIAIKDWFDHIPARESCGSGIYIRRFGANVEITDEEFQKMYPGRIAVKVLPD